MKHVHSIEDLLSLFGGRLEKASVLQCEKAIEEKDGHFEIGSDAERVRAWLLGHPCEASALGFRYVIEEDCFHIYFKDHNA